jgi:hypothetical protein
LPLPARVRILRAVPLSWNEIRHRAINFCQGMVQVHGSSTRSLYAHVGSLAKILSL